MEKIKNRFILKKIILAYKYKEKDIKNLSLKDKSLNREKNLKMMYPLEKQDIYSSFLKENQNILEKENFFKEISIEKLSVKSNTFSLDKNKNLFKRKK